MNKFVSLHGHSIYSDSTAKPKDIVNFCVKNNIDTLALTDHGTLGGSFQFHSLLSAKNIKPILGVELYLSKLETKIRDQTNRSNHHLVVLAKNYDGWNSLLRIVNKTHEKDNFYYKPRIYRPDIANYDTKNLVSFSGHIGSELCNVCFNQMNDSDDKFEVESGLHDDWEQRGLQCVREYQEIFGDNFFIEVQTVTGPKRKLIQVIANCMRRLSKLSGVPKVATGDAHYIDRNQAELHRLMLCGQMKLHLRQVYDDIRKGKEVPYSSFFTDSDFYIPTYDDVKTLNSPDEIENTVAIADMCENYSLKKQPSIPQFGENPKKLIHDLATSRLNEINKPYHDRLNYELETICNAGLESYFLIVRDYIAAARNRGEMLGVGRGSSAGSLLAYLLDITRVDPIPYNLVFERFYNAGRNTKDNIAFPDIDTDFPASKRDDTVAYIKNKYGTDYVGNIVTYGRIKGKSALKEVIRAYGVLGFAEANQLCENIPEEGKIADELQQMVEDTGESSIIKWVLINKPKSFDGYCHLEDDGTLSGQFSKMFDQAMKLEGIIKNQSKHASGYIIGAKPLNETCPMIYDSKTNTQICGWEFSDLEKTGHLKFDILGIAPFDKVMCVKELLATEE